MLWFLVALAVASCSSLKAPDSAQTAAPAPTTTPVAAVVTTVPEDKPPVVEITPELKEKAAQFERFLTKKLSSAEEKSLRESCRKEPGKNPFCYAVENSEELEAGLHPKPERRARKPRIPVRFSGTRIVNWKDIRGANINHLLRTFNRVSRARLNAAKVTALQEMSCPNNAAIAIAATLEDQLPIRADINDLAMLYERGGKCLTDPDDRESILTRAGLFYYLKKDLARAAVVWKEAAAVAQAAKSPRPLYWYYRVQAELGEKAAAEDALDKLKEYFPFAFHTILARLRNGQDPDDILDREAPKLMRRSDRVPAVNPLVEAAELLKASGLPKAESKVLDWAIADSATAEPELRIYLAQMKADLSETHHAIFLLSKILVENPRFASRKILLQYFPKAYLPLFEKHAQGQGLDPYLLLSVARQESAFDSRAVSTAKAKGLLQVVAKRSRRNNLFDPETNIRTGAQMFSQMLAQNDRRVHLALSAYNAGPRRVMSWVKRYTTVDPILFIDLIPFKETRAYVALILRNYYWYRRLHNPAEARLPWIALNDADRTRWLSNPALATKTP